MNKISKFIYFLTVTLFLLFFNQYFSALILNSLRFNIRENPFLDLIFVQNTGAAFSILENSQNFLMIFSVFAIIVVIFLVIKYLKKLSTITIFWVGMLLSGIICNLYERLVFGYVRDYFKLNFIEFPVFNISDMFINIGVIALIIIIIKKNYR